MIYQRIRDLREDKDKNQEEIAEMLKISKTQYGRYERSECDIPFEITIKLAEYYRVSLDYIAGRTNDKRGLTRSEMTEEETNIIKEYRSLSENRKGKLTGYLLKLYEDEKEEKAIKKEAV